MSVANAGRRDQHKKGATGDMSVANAVRRDQNKE
jgi:hypothetical protein